MKPIKFDEANKNLLKPQNMTDNEIIKALNICAKNDKCWLCPIQKKCKGFPNLHKEALDLINRQKAEIERKTIECERLEIYMDELVKQKLNQAKSKAIKVFAERLKVEFKPEQNYDNIANFTIKLFTNTIDNLVKEMVGENDV